MDLRPSPIASVLRDDLGDLPAVRHDRVRRGYGDAIVSRGVARVRAHGELLVETALGPAAYGALRGRIGGGELAPLLTDDEWFTLLRRVHATGDTELIATALHARVDLQTARP